MMLRQRTYLVPLIALAVSNPVWADGLVHVWNLQDIYKKETTCEITIGKNQDDALNSLRDGSRYTGGFLEFFNFKLWFVGEPKQKHWIKFYTFPEVVKPSNVESDSATCGVADTWERLKADLPSNVKTQHKRISRGLWSISYGTTREGVYSKDKNGHYYKPYPTRDTVTCDMRRGEDKPFCVYSGNSPHLGFSIPRTGPTDQDLINLVAEIYRQY